MTDILDRLRAADPAAGLPTPRPRDIGAELDAVMARADGQPPAERSLGGRQVHPRLWVAAAAVCLIAGGLVIAPLDLEGSGPSSGPGIALGPAASAAEILDRAATITPADPATHPGQYWRITSTGTRADVSAVGRVRVIPYQRVDYVAVDGRARSYSVDSGIVDDATGAARPFTDDVPPVDRPASWGTPTPAFLAALPRDPVALRTRLYADTAGSGNSADGAAFTGITDVLRSGLVPADLRATLFRVLTTIPDVEVTSRQASAGGHPGVGIGMKDAPNGTRYEIVVDPATGVVVGEREVLVAVPPRPTDVPADAAPEVRDAPHAWANVPVGTVLYEVRIQRDLIDAVPRDIVDTARCEVIDFPGRTTPPAC